MVFDTYLHPILCHIFNNYMHDKRFMWKLFFLMCNLPCFHPKLKNIMYFFFNPFSLALFQSTQLKGYKSGG